MIGFMNSFTFVKVIFTKLDEIFCLGHIHNNELTTTMLPETTTGFIYSSIASTGLEPILSHTEIIYSIVQKTGFRE